MRLQNPERRGQLRVGQNSNEKGASDRWRQRRSGLVSNFGRGAIIDYTEAEVLVRRSASVQAIRSRLRYRTERAETLTKAGPPPRSRQFWRARAVYDKIAEAS